MVYVPAVVYVCAGDGPVPEVPSPKFQAYDVIVPSGSAEPADENDTAVPAVPLYGPFASATGFWFAANGPTVNRASSTRVSDVTAVWLPAATTESVVLVPVDVPLAPTTVNQRRATMNDPLRALPGEASAA